jgi:hypothetical protein
MLGYYSDGTKIEPNLSSISQYLYNAGGKKLNIPKHTYVGIDGKSTGFCWASVGLHYISVNAVIIELIYFSKDSAKSVMSRYFPKTRCFQTHVTNSWLNPTPGWRTVYSVCRAEPRSSHAFANDQLELFQHSIFNLLLLLSVLKLPPCYMLALT